MRVLVFFLSSLLFSTTPFRAWAEPFLQQTVRPCVISYADPLDLSLQALEVMKKYEQQMNLIEPHAGALNDSERMEAAQIWGPEGFYEKMSALYSHVLSEVKCREIPELIRNLMMESDPQKTLFQVKAWQQALKWVGAQDWTLRWEKKLRELRLDYSDSKAVQAIQTLEIQRAAAWASVFRLNDSDQEFSKIEGFPKNKNQGDQILELRRSVKKTYNALLQDFLAEQSGFSWVYFWMKYPEEPLRPCPFKFKGIYVSRVKVQDQNQNVISVPHRLTFYQSGCYGVIAAKKPLDRNAPANQTNIEIFQFTGKRYPAPWDQPGSGLESLSEASAHSFKKSLFDAKGVKLRDASYLFEESNHASFILRLHFPGSGSTYDFRYERDVEEEARNQTLRQR